ncbi:TetR/AcrR family transcriptional regulator [Streptacidiphilus pinicola]|uniref:TetR/AcrR family transcriptional regulator n=1 Tax=Streptacidiphilus pinicola TaxID=2219663 RepID=A0A2X0IET7_9ACTN|nr:TetR family transcriptional regulator [Streptacidiphilus pinicola]RAG83542.1 TetR/AcrR family transcriptional regulator [Streptacidiphilus pinicola]
MAEAALTPEDILAAAEDVLRRYGPGKATVVDVARALGVSHGTVYRHFPSKAALRGAVTRRWLDRAHAALPGIAAGPEEPGERLRLWLAALFRAKQEKALADPELFATYQVLVGENSELIAEHVSGLEAQLAEIIVEGQERGSFASGDPGELGHVVFQATAHYHDPGYSGEWSRPGVDDEFHAVVGLVLRGLAAG